MPAAEDVAFWAAWAGLFLWAIHNWVRTRHVREMQKEAHAVIDQCNEQLAACRHAKATFDAAHGLLVEAFVDGCTKPEDKETVQ